MNRHLLAVAAIVIALPSCSDVVTDVESPDQGDPNTVYVSPAGQDDALGTLDQPKRSVSQAIAAAVAAGRSTVALLPGRYSASTTGDSFPLIVPAGVALTAAYRDSARPVLDAEGTAGVLRIESALGVTISGLRITGGVADSGGGIHIDGLAAVLVEDVQIDGNRSPAQGSGIHAARGAQLVLRNSLIVANTSVDSADAHGVEVRDATALIYNNVIGYHDSNGLLIVGTSIADVRNNIFVANGRTTPTVRGRGICEVSSPHRTTIRYNLFYGNALAAVLFSGSGNLTANQANELSGSDDIAGNFEADPLFTDAASLDFSLLAASPARDAGDPNPLFNDEDGTRNDIGCWGGKRVR